MLVYAIIMISRFDIIPTEIWHRILSFTNGFEFENMRPVCKIFNTANRIANPKDPIESQEVRLIRWNCKTFSKLGKLGYYSIIKQKLNALNRDNYFTTCKNYIML